MIKYLFKSNLQFNKPWIFSKYFTSNTKNVDLHENQVLNLFCEFDILTEKIKNKYILKCYSLGIHVDNQEEKYDLSLIKDEKFSGGVLNYRSYISLVGACYCVDIASRIISCDPDKYKEIIVHIPSNELIEDYYNTSSSKRDTFYKAIFKKLSVLIKLTGKPVNFKHFLEVKKANELQIKIAKKLSLKALKLYRKSENLRDKSEINDLS